MQGMGMGCTFTAPMQFHAKLQAQEPDEISLDFDWAQRAVAVAAKRIFTEKYINIQPNMQAALIKLVLLSLLIGATKAAHFRMMMFGLLGLAGLWMMQNVARASGGGTSEDRGQGLFPNLSVASIANRFLTKRSIEDFPPSRVAQINWEAVMENDHSTCTRSYVCQIVAMHERDLHPEEAIMLNIIRQSKELGATNWATKQIHLAARSGEKWRNTAVCMKIYKRCPYTSSTMRRLLSTLDADASSK